MALKQIQASLAKPAETLGFQPEDALTGVIQQQLRVARDDVQRWKDLGDELNAVAEELEVAKTEADEAHKELDTLKAAWHRRREKRNEMMDWIKNGNAICGIAEEYMH